MGASSNEVSLPSGEAGCDGDSGFERSGGAGHQISSERFSRPCTSSDDLRMPSWSGSRSVSVEDQAAAETLIDCRKDWREHCWGELLTMGGENVPSSRKESEAQIPEAGSSGASVSEFQSSTRTTASSHGNFVSKAQREQQHVSEVENLILNMPVTAPFSGGSGRSSRSSSRKAKLTSPRNLESEEPSWPMSLDLLLSNYKSSSGSSSASGGGGAGWGGGGDTAANAGGGTSNSTGGGGGSSSWGRICHPGAVPTAASAGGSATTHDTTGNNGGKDTGVKSIRQQSFDPDREIGDYSSTADNGGGLILPHGEKFQQPAPAPSTYAPSTYAYTAAASVSSSAGGGMAVGRFLDVRRQWGYAPAMAAATRAIPISAPVSGSHNYIVRASIATPPFTRMADTGHIPQNTLRNPGHASYGSIAPAPAPRAQPPPPAPVPAPAYVPASVSVPVHDVKDKICDLADLIPGVPTFSGPSNARSLYAQAAAAAVAGATLDGKMIAAEGGLASVTVADGVGIEDDRVSARQVSLARYRRKKKRRAFVKEARENDPSRKEQNKARERPRQDGKFKKKTPDFEPITRRQGPARSRSISGEVPPPPPPPPPSSTA